MSHSHHSTKNLKKKPLLTPKEKKQAKHARKHKQEVQPFITPVTH